MDKDHRVGHVKISNRWFHSRMPAIIEDLRAQSDAIEIPEELVELDIIGPRITAWGPFRRTIKGRTIALERGQCVLAYGLFREMYGWHRSKAQRWIAARIEDGFLTPVRRAGNSGTVYQVTRYDEIQATNAAAFSDTPDDTPADTPEQRHYAGCSGVADTHGDTPRDTTRQTNATNQTTKQRTFHHRHESEVPGPDFGVETTANAVPLADVGGGDDAGGEAEGARPETVQGVWLPEPCRGAFRYPREFEAVWSVSWSRGEHANSKKAAYREYRSLRSLGIGHETLLEAVRRETDRLARVNDAGTKRAKMLSTFLGPDDHWMEALNHPIAQPEAVQTNAHGPRVPRQRGTTTAIPRRPRVHARPGR